MQTGEDVIIAGTDRPGWVVAFRLRIAWQEPCDDGRVLLGGDERRLVEWEQRRLEVARSVVSLTDRIP